MENNQNFFEKRVHERHTLAAQPDYSINLRTPNEEKFHNAVSVNISYGGMMFVSDCPYACNSKIETLIKFSKNNEPSIVLQGTVRWIDENQNSEEEQNSYNIGIQFNKMQELEEIAFKLFIDTFIINY